MVWKAGDINVREACERLGSSVAYTTVMTTMDRLFKKRLLSRRKVGRAFVYTATATRDEMEGAVATELVQNLLQRHGGEPLPLLSSLVDAVSDRDRALLDDLERLIREKRRADRTGEEPMNAFLLHGVTLALAWFLVFNAAMTAAVALLAARLAQRERSGSPALWLALRLAPAVLSIAFVAVGVSPVVLAVRAARRGRRLRPDAHHARRARGGGDGIRRRARRDRLARRGAPDGRLDARVTSAGARRHVDAGVRR